MPLDRYEGVAEILQLYRQMENEAVSVAKAKVKDLIRLNLEDNKFSATVVEWRVGVSDQYELRLVFDLNEKQYNLVVAVGDREVMRQTKTQLFRHVTEAVAKTIAAELVIKIAGAMSK